MKRDKIGATINTKQIEKMIEEIKKSQTDWHEFTLPNKKKNPPAIIPTVWTVPSIDENAEKDLVKEVEERELIRFMQECRERTAAMKDDEKCAKCKLRFRCYTEIKVEKKRKTRVRKPKKGTISTMPIKQIYCTQAQPLTMPKGVWNEGFDDEWRKIILDVGNNSESNFKEEG